MSAFQNPNSEQIPYPIPSNPYPNPRAAPTPTPISKVLTFEDVSKFFSSPLSDAADSLGVCTSVVRRICHENGLESWPYRKVRAGKSIEDIRRQAARVKYKRVMDLPSAARQVNSVSITKTAPSSYLNRTSQVEDKSASSMQTFLKPPNVLQQGTNKNPPPPTGNNTQKSQVSNFPGGASADLDEFKYGFPSDGLAFVSYKWWGSSDSNSESKTTIQNGGKEDITEKNETTKNSNLDRAEEEGLLSGLRKRAVKEGEEALKLGIHRKYNLKKLNSKKKTVLVQIFKSSLPSQWIDE